VFSIAGASAGSEFMDKFKSDYSLLDMDLLNNMGEIATVENFVYQKDVATFTFKSGVIHLLRYVDERPTTAIFVGEGHASINIPYHLERRSLMSVTKDSVVNEDFEVCLIRMADDFDLKLKELFPVEQKELKWKNFNAVKQAQSEVYFRPVVYHKYDNYFQLLRSVYERSADGFFWIDFNRYNFCFDPNQPEEVIVSYEFEAADKVATGGACFRRQEAGITDDMGLSNLEYPTTAVEKLASLRMGGIDGTKIDKAECTMPLVVNADSLKFVSAFLHFNLKEDSIHLNGKPVDYHRRKDFSFIGIILPEYAHKGDTLNLTFWYDGKDYNYSLPFVNDPTPVPHAFTFTIPKGFNYIMPGMSEITNINGEDQFTVVPDQPYYRFYFQGYASGYDTVTALSDVGISVNFLKAKHITKQYDCFVPHELYENSVMGAFNYMTGRLGNPVGTFEIFVYPAGYWTMPGMIQVPQVVCYSDAGLEYLGGFDIFAGYSVAKQWFGNLMRPASERELWLRDAAAEYLALLYVQHSAKGSAYFSNLLSRRDTLYTVHGLHREQPLATGLRSTDVIRCNKGVWLFHMLRFLMFDLNDQSESKFFRFLYELCLTCNNTRYTNQDVMNLAEKHYGQPLDWFFRQWLCGYGYPEYDVKYSIERKDEGYFVIGNVETDGVPGDFRMPVVMRVESEAGQSTFFRENVTAPDYAFELGPMLAPPKELIFNEFFSVLSKDNVSKK